LRLLAHVSKDARLLVRHRVLLAVLLAYPLVLTGVLAAAFQEPPDTLTLAVHDADAGTLELPSGNLTTSDVLASASAYADIHVYPSQAAAIQMVRDGQADAALLIPRGFLDSLTSLGENATLRLVVDESDAIRAGVAAASVEGAIEAFLKRVIEQKIRDVDDLLALTRDGGTTRIGPVPVAVLGIDAALERIRQARDTFARDSNDYERLQQVVAFLVQADGILADSTLYLTTTAQPLSIQREGLAGADTRLHQIVLPGALVLGLSWTGALAGALLWAREHDAGTLRRLHAAPAAGLVTATSKTLVGILAGLLPALIILALAAVVLSITPTSWSLTLLALLAASAGAVGLGQLASRVAHETASSSLVVVLALVPMLMLGGLFYPIAYMPAAAQAVARVLPLTLATDALRGAMVRGDALADILPALAGLFLLGALGVVLGRPRVQ